MSVQSVMSDHDEEDRRAYQAVEKWAELEEFPNYAVSSWGNVANMKFKRERRIMRNQQGIAMVSLTNYDGRPVTRSVGLLVAEAFVDGRTHIFDTPIYLDGDRMNCEATNLSWRPRWYAVKYHQQFNYAWFHTAAPLIELLNTGERFRSIKEPCIKYGLLGQDVIKSYTENQSVLLSDMYFRLL